MKVARIKFWFKPTGAPPPTDADIVYFYTQVKGHFTDQLEAKWGAYEGGSLPTAVIAFALDAIVAAQQFASAPQYLTPKVSGSWNPVSNGHEVTRLLFNTSTQTPWVLTGPSTATANVEAIYSILDITSMP